MAADVAILAIGHSARDTYSGCCSAAAVPLQAKPFQLGVRIEQPQRAHRRGPATGRTPRHPALGAADYNLVAHAETPRPVHLLHVRRRVQVMPSVSDPGYFCTNGMSQSRHDSPFANSGLVVTITPEETGSRHPLAGVHYQQRDPSAWRISPAIAPTRLPIQRARDFLAGRASRGKIPTSYTRTETVADSTSGLILPPIGPR